MSEMIPNNYEDRVEYYMNEFNKRNLAVMLSHFTIEREAFVPYELERLQYDMAWTIQVWSNENYMGRQSWMQQMCEVYADLAKEVEAQYHGVEEE